MDKRVALITGAATGIGAAIANRLARDGFRVVLGDIDGPAASDTAAQLGAHGLDAWPIVMDVGSAESIAAGFAAIAARYERCDVLVNNAGIAKTFGFLDYPIDDWNRVMAVNVTGPLHC